LQASRQVHATCVEGRLGEQIEGLEAEGDWQTLVENLNQHEPYSGQQVATSARRGFSAEATYRSR
jgi:hypothetical protein